MKTKVSKMVFANLSGIRDHRSLEKMAAAYGKLKAEQAKKPNPHVLKKLERLKEEINQLMPEAEQGLARILKVYEDATKDIGDDNITYTKQDVNTIVDEVKKMQADLANYKKLVE